MSDAEDLEAFRKLDAYTLGDSVRRSGVGGVIHALKPQTTATTFAGRALTARIHYDPHKDIPVKGWGSAALREKAGPGDVVVLDGGGQMLSAMGALAYAVLSQRRAAAAVLHGCIRDVEQMEEMNTGLPVFALGTVITSMAGHGYVTDIGQPVYVQGIRIATGDVVAGCRGGVVVVPWEERHRVLAEGQAIIESDRLVFEGFRRGELMSDLWKKHK